MKFNQVLFLLGALLICGCASTGNKKTEPSYTFLFPHDMSEWSCSNYLSYLKSNHQNLYGELKEVLKKRPHKFLEQADLKFLKPLSIEYVPDKKKARPSYFVMVHKTAIHDLIQLVQAASRAGYDLRVQSAFRSVPIQNYLWQSAVRTAENDHQVAAFKTAPPCYSEHATGKSVDFSLADTEAKIAENDVYPWLLKNASKYGWIQSFPAGAKHTTKDPDKPGLLVEEWHFKHKSLN